MANVWYSFRKSGAYEGDVPAFLNTEGKTWFENIKAQQPEIQKAVLQLLEQDQVKRNEYFNTDLVEGQMWGGVGFLFWGQENKKNAPFGKDIIKYFLPIPGLVSLSISVLSPHTHIKPHYGDTDGIYRLHVPVLIPAMLPDCGFKVAGKEVSWDKPFAFCDAHYHEAWNNTGKARVILIADIIREDIIAQKEQICRNVLSYLEIQKIYLKYKVVRNSPWFIKGIIRHLLLLRIKLTGRSTMTGE